MGAPGLGSSEEIGPGLGRPVDMEPGLGSSEEIDPGLGRPVDMDPGLGMPGDEVGLSDFPKGLKMGMLDLERVMDSFFAGTGVGSFEGGFISSVPDAKVLWSQKCVGRERGCGAFFGGGGGRRAPFFSCEQETPCIVRRTETSIHSNNA